MRHNRICYKYISMPYVAFLKHAYAANGILNNQLCHYEYLIKLIMPDTAFLKYFFPKRTARTPGRHLNINFYLKIYQ